MVELQTEAMQQGISELIENYRMALKFSKVRGQKDEVENERLTRCFRVPTVMAEDLARVIPKLIDPTSWQQQTDVADAFATIEVTAFRPELLTTTNGKDPNSSIKLEFPVLLIVQTLKNHQAIEQLIVGSKSATNRFSFRATVVKATVVSAAVISRYRLNNGR